MEKKIKIAVLGCGRCGTRVVGNLLRDSGRQVGIDLDKRPIPCNISIW